jgi:hypothetical protein
MNRNNLDQSSAYSSVALSKNIRIAPPSVVPAPSSMQTQDMFLSYQNFKIRDDREEGDSSFIQKMDHSDINNSQLINESARSSLQSSNF